MLTIYHNPQCTKSRNALKQIEAKGIPFQVIEYLKEIPSKNELKEVLSKLNLKPLDIVRTGEQIFKDNFKGKTFTDAEWIDVLVENPKLIQRPIVFDDKKAVIGREPGSVEKLL